MVRSQRARLPRAPLDTAALAILCAALLASCTGTVDASPTESTTPGTAAVADVTGAIVHVSARATQCETASFGTGFVVAAGRVLTSAHVLAGADRVVVAGADGEGVTAAVVHFDPHRDLAIVAAPGLDAVPLDYVDEVAPDEAAAVVSFRSSTGITTKPVVVEARDSVVSNGIHHDSTVTLDVWTVEGDIAPGDSGAPLVTERGIVGLVFAQDEDEPRGYAVALTHLAPLIERAASYTIKSDTGSCLAP